MKFIKYTLVLALLSTPSFIAFGQDLPPATQSEEVNQTVNDGPGDNPAQPGGGTAVPLDSPTMLMLLAGVGIVMTFFAKPKKKEKSSL
jgi:hypothetical protein